MKLNKSDADPFLVKAAGIFIVIAAFVLGLHFGSWLFFFICITCGCFVFFWGQALQEVHDSKTNLSISSVEMEMDEIKNRAYSHGSKSEQDFLGSVFYEMKEIITYGKVINQNGNAAEISKVIELAWQEVKSGVVREEGSYGDRIKKAGSITSTYIFELSKLNPDNLSLDPLKEEAKIKVHEIISTFLEKCPPGKSLKDSVDNYKKITLKNIRRAANKKQIDLALETLLSVLKELE